MKQLTPIDLQLSQGQAVLGLMERTRVPPFPTFYKLFYDYVAGVKGLLAQRLDTVLNADAPAEEPTRDMLYREFVAPYTPDSETFEVAAARIAVRLKALEGLMNDSQIANAAQAKSLAQAHAALSQDGLGRRLMLDLVTRLAVVTDDLKRANSALGEQLDEAFAELEDTREQLRKSGESARRDPLTGVLNLAGIDMTLSQLVSDAASTGRDFSLAVVDIDHFKALNDGYGHRAGDEVLRLAARLLQSASREIDSVGRVGGDEFVVILPGADIVIAKDLAGGFCKAVRDYELGDLLGRDVVGGMTVSIGVSCYRSGDSIASLFERADKALYDAKGAGRNRVSVAS